MTLGESRRGCHMLLAGYRSGSMFRGTQQFAILWGKQVIDLVELEIICYNDAIFIYS